MFSFLSQLRLPSIGIGTQPQEEDDDASSSGRSLTLPFPVTESSAKKTPASTAAKREWMANHPVAPSTAGANGFNISKPIPRTANALTAFDTEFPAPPTGLGEQVYVYGHVRPVRATPPYSGAAQGAAWYEQDKSNIQASVVPPPHVVRLNSIIGNPSNDANKQKGGNVNVCTLVFYVLMSENSSDCAASSVKAYVQVYFTPKPIGLCATVPNARRKLRYCPCEVRSDAFQS